MNQSLELAHNASDCGRAWARKDDATDAEINAAADQFGNYAGFFFAAFDRERWWRAETTVSPMI